MKILLVGNPNAGKSTLFNALTGGRARVGNWHGVTVGALCKETTIGEKRVEICDLPGIYSLDSMSMEEKLTRDYLAEHGDAVLFVAECATLSRALPLLCALKKEGRNLALALTKRKQFEKRGGKLNETKLSEELKIPVFTAEKLSRSALKERISACFAMPKVEGDAKEQLSVRAYTPQSNALTRTEKLFLSGYFCIPLFLCILFTTFYLTFASGSLGDFLKSGIENFFCGFLAGKAENIPSPVLRSFLVDGILTGTGGVLSFLPQIAILYLALILMEESGLMSRLAYHTDGIFSAVGLNGRAFFSLLMGFGCTAAAITSTRGLDDKRIQRRAILCLPYVSCSAKLPVYLVIASSFCNDPFPAVLFFYALGIAISLIVALFIRRENPPFLMELAPLQLPRPLFVAKSLCFQMKQFIIKTATVILAFFIASWLLSSFSFAFTFCGEEESMLASVCRRIAFLFAPIGCNDWRIAYAAVSGLFAKENVAGVLLTFCGGFPYGAQSALAFGAFLLTCSPCVSAIAACAREMGWKHAIIYAALQTLSALLFAYAVYFAVTGGAVYLAIAATPLIGLFILGKKKVEKIHRKRNKFAEKLHR